jgi:hypothetical protein
LMYPRCEYTVHWSVQPSLLLSLTLSPLPTIIQQFSAHIIKSSTCTDTMCFDIVDYHCLFLSLLPQVPESSSTITTMFSIWTCVWSCFGAGTELRALCLSHVPSPFCFRYFSDSVLHLYPGQPRLGSSYLHIPHNGEDKHEPSTFYWLRWGSA